MSYIDDVEQLRAPPWSPEAEQAVIGALFFDNRAFDRVGDILSGDDFFDSRHREIWAAIVPEIVANKPADVITIFETLKRAGKVDRCGGLAYLSALSQAVPSAANVRRHAEIVREQAMQRRVISAADEALRIAWEAGAVADKIDTIGSLFGELQRQQVRKMPRPIAEIAIERIDHYEALENGTIDVGWPTHIPALDSRLNGGLRAGSLYILAARPSVGKSSLAQSLGLTFAGNGLPVLFLSLEMGEAEIADRGVASAGRVSYSALQTGKMDGDAWGRASEAMEKIARLPFFVDDQPALRLRDIRIKARSVKGLKVLVLDYLQLCAGSRRDDNRNGEIEEITRGLKTLAKELGIAVIALSQLNRDVEKRATKRPTLSDLRDSGAIEQDADVVLFMWPVREFETEGRRIIGLAIEKNRQGRLGEVGLDFFGDTQRWGESTADIRPDTKVGRYGREDNGL